MINMPDTHNSFLALVQLFGHPGDRREDWSNLLENHLDLLTPSEINSARNWVKHWDNGLKTFSQENKP